MKKFNGLSKGFMGVATVACLLFAAGVTGVPYYGSVGGETVAVAKKANKSNKANKAKKISADKAKKIALGDAKLAEKDVTFVKVELEFENNRLVYDVEFYSGNVEYDYDIDAVSGAIISSDRDIENYSIPVQQTTVAPAADIGVEKAKEIALAHAGLSGDKVSFVKAKLDYEDGVKVYDVEFYSGNVEYDYEIDAANGAILSVDKDIENYVIPTQPSKEAPTKAQVSEISVEEAKQIALSHAGVGSARFTKAKIDYENGIKVYEIEFKVGNMEYEYDINVSNGAIISSSAEIDD